MRPGARILLGAVLAAAFTVVIVHWSLRHGRLILPPTYDDVGYLGDGMARLDVLYRDRLPGVLAEHFRRPPHSPFSSYLALASFAFFGAHDWAPYAGNVVIVLALLAFVDHLLRGSPWWARAAGAVFALTVPVTGSAVAECRPDVAAGLMTAMGAILLLDRPLFSASQTQRQAAGACFGLALLFKPTAFSLTLGLLGLALVVATLSDRARLPSASVRGVAPAWASVLWPVALLGLPQYVVTGRYYYDYFQWNILGTSHPWRSQAGAREQLAYYLTGPGGQAQLGRHLYVLGAIVVLGALLRARRGGGSLQPLPGQLIVAAAALAVPSLHPVKQIFFGVTFAFLLLFMAVDIFAAGMALPVSRRDWRPLGVAALVLIGACCAQWPVYWGDAGDPAVAGRNRLAGDILRSLHERAAGSPSRVFVTAPGRINPDLLQYMARRDGLRLQFSRLCGPRVACIYLSDELGPYRQEVDEADFVLVGEPGHSEEVAELPSARVQQPLLELLRSRSDYVERERFPTLNDKSFLLFERLGPFHGWSGSRGLLDPEGPYPQWQLPVVRWGCGPSTTLTFADRSGGAMRLVIDGRSGFAGQTMTVRLDDHTLAQHVFREPPVFERLDLPLDLGPGTHAVELDFTAWEPAPESPKRAVLFRTLQVVPALRGR